jgi:hypothetical protein
MTGAILISIFFIATAPDLSQELPAAYQIKAYLNDSTHTISGTEAVTFLNPTEKPLNTISFHLYPNAFGDTSSVYCREDRHTRDRVAGGNNSGIDIQKISVYGREIGGNGYRIDGTRLYIDLERPLLPRRKIDIGLEFEILIPEMIGHFGYDSDGAYLIAHCFPILCGYQKGLGIPRQQRVFLQFFLL